MRLIRVSATPDSPLFEPDGAPTLFGCADGRLLDGAREGEPLGVIGPHRTPPLRSGAEALDDYMRRSFAGGPPRRILALAHGFEFEPRAGILPGLPPDLSPNPHVALFHDRPATGGAGSAAEHRLRATPWLRRLRLAEDDVVICFAYSSDPGLLSVECVHPGTVLEGARRRLWGRMVWGDPPEEVNLFGYAYGQAADWAGGLAAALAVAARQAPYAKIDILCHSLGAWTAMATLRRMVRFEPEALGRVDRVVMLAAALLPLQAVNVSKELARAGSRVQIFNIASAADRVLRNIGAPLGEDASHGVAGLTGRRRPGRRRWPLLSALFNPPEIVGVDGRPADLAPIDWIDIQLDAPETRRWGRAGGLNLRGDLRETMWDHWVHFTHPDNWQLYNHILNDKDDWSIAAIRAGVTRGGREMPPHSGRVARRRRPGRITRRPASDAPTG